MAVFRRRNEKLLAEMLDSFPAILLVGARQTGKSFLARQIAASRPSIFFDLEKSADLRQLADPGVELRSHPGKLIVIDEIQHLPELFNELRSIIDEERFAGSGCGKFLLLGSVAGKLQRQSESLAGRIARVRLQTLDLLEARSAGGLHSILPAAAQHLAGSDPDEALLSFLWARGGYPQSVLAESDQESRRWLRNYLIETIKKDAVAPRVSEKKFTDLLRLIADKQGSVVTKQAFAEQLQLNNRTIANMLEVMEEMMLIRSLPGYARSIKQQVRKATKYYICDSGVQLYLLNRNLADLQDIDSARLRGGSWEGFALQNMVAALPDDWSCFYFEPTQGGGGVDLVIEKPGGALWAIEIKSSSDPNPDQLLRASGKLRPERSFLVHGSSSGYRRRGDIITLSLPDMMNEILTHAGRGAKPLPITAGSRASTSSAQYQAVMAAIEQGYPNLNLRRDEFIAYCLVQAQLACQSATGSSDAQARHVWVQVRTELLAWLGVESRRSPDDRQWQRLLTEVLQGVVQLPRPSSAATEHDLPDRFARLCCHDLLVGVVAGLLATNCHGFVGRLLARRWLVHGSMCELVCFCAPDLGKPDDGRACMSVAEFVGGDAGGHAPLIAAELLLLVAGMNRSEMALARNRQESQGSAGFWCWSPRLMNKTGAVPLLEFFRHTENREGMEDFLLCLGIVPKPDAVTRLVETVEKHLAIHSGHLPKSKDDLIDSLNLVNWHDLAD